MGSSESYDCVFPIDNTRKKIVHAWKEIESYVRYMTNDENFDLATAWKKEEHGELIDILDPFKRRTSARIEFGFNSQLEEDIEVLIDSEDPKIEN